MLLQLFDITYKRNGQTILDHLCLNFESNGLVLITGKSGSGKSTLLHIIGRIALPNSGEVLLDGKSYINPSRFYQKSLYQADISFIFQGYHLLEHLTVFENLAIFGFEKEVILTYLKKVEMQDYLNTKMNKLSGGQKQRIAVVRAMLIKPRILLADEPTAALDQQTAILVKKWLKEFSKDSLVIVVSHDMQLFEKDKDRLIELDHGKVVKDQIIQKKMKLPKHHYKQRLLSKKEMYKYIFSDIKTRWGRITVTSLSAMMSVVILFFIFGIYGGMEKYIHNLQENAFEKNVLVVEKTDYPPSSLEVNEQEKLKQISGVIDAKESQTLVNVADEKNKATFHLLPEKITASYYGRLPNQINEIMISLDLAKSINADLENIIDKSYYLQVDGEEKEYIISGYTYDITQYKTIYFPDCWMAEDSGYQFITDLAYVLYFEDYLSLKQGVLEIQKLLQYTYSNDFYFFENNLKNVIYMAMVTLFIFACIVMIISGMVSYMMHYASLLQKRKEIITLELYGINKKEITSIFLIEGFLLSVLSVMMGFLTFIIFRPLVNQFITNFIDKSLIRFIVVPFKETMISSLHIPCFAYFINMVTVLGMTCFTILLSLSKIMHQDKSYILKEDDLC